MRSLHHGPRTVSGLLILVAGVLLLTLEPGSARANTVLLVDDVLDRVNPRDSQRDQFWADRFASYGITPQVFDVWGDDDRFSVPRSPTLTELSQHDILVWNVDGGGYSGSCALLDLSKTGVLGDYLRGGGRLWVVGRLSAAALVPPGEDGTTGDFTYPKEPEPGSFLWDYVKLRGVTINNDKAANNPNRLAGVNPDSGAVENEFAAMSVDVTKLNRVEALLGGITYCDAIMMPNPFAAPDSLNGDLQSLYEYRAVGEESPYNRKACAVRWRDPVAEPEHGRVMWFGFQLYYMNDGEAQDTFDKAMDWVRGVNDPPVPIRMLYLDVAREGANARLRWGVADPTDHAGFHVYRGRTADARRQLTRMLLSGRTHYEFVDRTAPGDGARYWLAELARDGTRAWHGPIDLAPRVAPGVVLSPALPNPFADQTRIDYRLPRAGSVRIAIHDVTGRRVYSREEGLMAEGSHVAVWNGRTAQGRLAPAGLYFFTLESEGRTRTTKVVFQPR